MSNQFKELKLKDVLLKNLTELKYESMTPIQEKSLPFILDGKDVLAKAKTGSGKTAAFGLGILNELDCLNVEIQSLVICPTRELAQQVATELRRLARQISNVKILTITGGESEYHQVKSLEHGAHIIVGTPGRILKLIKTKKLDLQTVTKFVLDEADRMLDMGFHDDILRISHKITSQHQTLLFSATFPENIKELASKVQNEAVEVSVDTGHAREIIKQDFIRLDSHKNKLDALWSVLSFYRPSRVLVFCKTKQITDSVADFLDSKGVFAESIHGDLMQRERSRVLTMFSNFSLNALVATDVAARGLDIQDLELVVNFDIPNDPEVYTHRIGRTARAGKTGNAISFFVEQELEKVDRICNFQNESYTAKEVSDFSVTNEYDLTPAMRTIFISGGKKDKIRPGDIVGAIVGEAGVDANNIGDIKIDKLSSYIAIKKEVVETVIEALNNGRIKKRKFKSGLL